MKTIFVQSSGLLLFACLIFGCYQSTEVQIELAEYDVSVDSAGEEDIAGASFESDTNKGINHVPTDTDSHTGRDTTLPDTQTDAVTDSEISTETGMATETATDTDTATQIDTETHTDTETQTDTETAPDTDIGTDTDLYIETICELSLPDGTRAKAIIGPYTKVEGPGDLPMSDVAKVFSARCGAFVSCYLNTMKTNPTVEGKLLQQVTLSAFGTVINSTTLSSNMPDSTSTCINSLLLRLRFSTRNDSTMVFNVAIDFAPLPPLDTGVDPGTATDTDTGIDTNTSTDLDPLTRVEVIAVMQAVEPFVLQCGQGLSGIFRMRIKIEPSGDVSGAIETGDHAGTPQAECAEQAVLDHAVFRPANSSLSLTYPFRL